MDSLPPLPRMPPQQHVAPPAGAPLAVQPLGYAMPSAIRPGMLSAIGIISIVIGSLGIIGNGMAGCQGLAFLWIAGLGNFAPMNAPLAAGWTAEQTESVLDQLHGEQPMTDGQREQLRLLLIEHGMYLAVSPVNLRLSITQAGTAQLDGDDGVHYTVLGVRLEASDTQSRMVLGGSTVLTPTPGRRPTLDPRDVELAVSRVIQATAPSVPTEQQLQTLTEQLSAPHQNLVDLSLLTGPGGPVGYASIQPDGQLDVYFTSGNMLYIRSDGTLTGPTDPFAFVQQLAAPMGLLGVEALFASALSIYLLVIGIAAVRGSRASAKLHWWYVWLKLPLIVLSIVGTIWLAQRINTHLGPVAGGGDLAGLWVWLMIGLVAVVAYPLFLVFALRSPSVREYCSVSRF